MFGMEGRLSGMAADQSYDEAKFTELLLYVAEQLKEDPEGGAIKLNMALWWSECAHLRMHGRPISGVEFQKLEQGPAPRRRLPVRTALGVSQDRLVPTRPADVTLLSNDERAIVDQVIESINGKSATQLSLESHEEMGWKMVGFGETIPLSSAYLSHTTEVTPKMRSHARGLAEWARQRPHPRPGVGALSAGRCVSLD